MGDNTIRQIKDYWQTWMWRDAMRRIITVNCIVWFILWVLYTFTPVGNAVASMLALPADITVFATRPWALFTYMVTQIDFMHVLANMLWLLLFGRLYEMMRGGERLVVLYIYGGLAGALAFLACGLTGIDTHALMMGASCSVLAVIGAVWVLQPSWEVNLLMFGSVKIKWLSLAAAIFLVVISTTLDAFAAHGAGLLAGVVCAMCRRRNVDLMRPALAVWSWIRRAQPRPKAKPIARPANAGGFDEQELDELLKKISRSGYNSLTAAERQRLFDLSRRQKR